jgi:hypothetical protein
VKKVYDWMILRIIVVVSLTSYSAIMAMTGETLICQAKGADCYNENLKKPGRSLLNGMAESQSS